MHVVELLCTLVIAVHIEVVIPRLPESPLVAPPSDGKLQRLETNSQRPMGRFADKQMNMLRHNNIPNDFKLNSAADPLQCILKEISRDRRSQVSIPSITIKRHEILVTQPLVALKADHHSAILLAVSSIDDV